MEARATKIRVLVIDDSVVSRRMVARVVDATDDLVVEATAANGRIGIAKLRLRAFDAVVLDVEMPEMDGLETLAEIRQTHPKLPVIMFSSLTRKGAETTLDALGLGANDYVTKPTASSTGGAETHIADELIPRIRALCSAPADAPRRARGPVDGRPTSHLPAPAPGSNPATRSPERRATVSAIGIGASTGGPNVLGRILGRLPRELPVPIFVVQHMPPIFTHLLAERLNGACALTVVEAEDRMPARPGWVYVAPGDFHMTVESDGLREAIALSRGPRENSCRPAVDVLFRSLAVAYGRQSIAAVLTGMGKDGLDGARRLIDAGARIIAQDEASSVVWGMPGYVARADLPELVAPPEALADALVRATVRHLSAVASARSAP